MRLSNNSKNIIFNRLIDLGIQVKMSELDNYLIDTNTFETLEEMYKSIIENWGYIIIK